MKLFKKTSVGNHDIVGDHIKDVYSCKTSVCGGKSMKIFKKTSVGNHDIVGDHVKDVADEIPDDMIFGLFIAIIAILFL
jgi:hypothetical protein